MKVLLTGASSYVGARIFFDLSKSFDITGTFSGNKLSDKFIHLDVRDSSEVSEVINKIKPNLIIHAASNADARWCDANKEAAILLNQTATRNIVDIANKIHAEIIYISSFAAIKKENVYGQTKAQSEEFVKEANNGFNILRPALTIGFSPNTINDRPFNRLLKNIDDNTPAIYDTSWYFQPTYAGHLSEVIIQILDKKIKSKTIAVAVKELKNRYEIAKDILGEFGISVSPIDKKDATSVITDDLKELDILNLTKYTYDEVIERCIEEIRNRSIFKI